MHEAGFFRDRGGLPCICNGLCAHFILGWVAKDIASAPNCFDVMLALCGGCEFLAKLTDKDVDDFKLWLVHAAVKVVKEHLFRQGRALTQREQFEHLVFFASQVDAVIANFDCFGV